MDWTLGPLPDGPRAIVATVSIAALAAGIAWGTAAAVDGAWLQAMAAAAVLPAALPSLRASVDRRTQGRLYRDDRGQWTDDRLGPILPPRPTIDGGSWVVLRLQSAASARRLRWVCVGRDATSGVDAWAACRRSVLVDAGRPQGAAR